MYYGYLMVEFKTIDLQKKNVMKKKNAIAGFQNS